jgi:hypothetical protein
LAANCSRLWACRAAGKALWAEDRRV